MYPEDEEEPENSGTTTYAWFVWEKRYTGSAIINWIYDKECGIKKAKVKKQSSACK